MKMDVWSSAVQVACGLMQPLGTSLLVMPHMKRGGPPLFLYSRNNEGDRLHHPRYARMIKKRADELKIEAVLYMRGENDPPKGDARKAQLDFFFKHLNVN